MRNKTAVPSFPTPEATYSAENERNFRQSVERFLTTIWQHVAPPASVGSPATLGATENNYDSGGRSVLRLTPHASGSTLTGLADGRDGREVTIVNLGSATLTLAHASGSSTDVNRLLSATNANVVLRADQSAKVLYDATTERWRIAPEDAKPTGTEAATMAAVVDNFAALANTAHLRVAAHAVAGTALSGITGGVGARGLTLINVGTPAQPLTLIHDNTSTAANRFFSPTGADVVIAPNGIASLVYDSTASRWLIVSTNTL